MYLYYTLYDTDYIVRVKSKETSKMVCVVLAGLLSSCCVLTRASFPKAGLACAQDPPGLPGAQAMKTEPLSRAGKTSVVNLPPHVPLMPA